MDNLTPTEKVIKIKKDVIKNIAIVFLAVMLVLTFFSNSIMNKSLPEVATGSISSGTITEAVRGSGPVTADDPYNVCIAETRTISGVAVKVGDTVEKDQVLFYLEDSESKELEEAETTLEDLIYKYTAGMLKGELSDSAYQNTVKGNVLSMSAYEAQISAAKAKLDRCNENVASISKQLSYNENSNDMKDKNVEVEKLGTELKEAEADLTDKNAKLTSLRTAVDGGLGAENSYNIADAELSESRQALYPLVYASLDGATSEQIATLKATFPGAYDNIGSGDNLKSLILDQTIGEIKDEGALADWIRVADASTLTEKYTDYEEKKVTLESAWQSLRQYREAQKRLSDAESEVNSAKNKVDELKSKIKSLNNDIGNNKNDKEKQKNDLTIAKADAEAQATKAKDELTQLLLDISKTLEMTNQSSLIKEQQEKVEKLREKSVGATIKSPVDGTILTITKASGEKTTADEALATIQVAGKGMTLSFSVPNEQAKKVSVGDTAEIQNGWYYEDVKINLTKIKNDPDNPSTKKMLIFNVEGSVNNGETLNLSVGTKSRDYDQVVPNSAVHEDNSGKFILIIEEKSTPFGTRYKAKKVNIEVITKDDKNSAINAAVDDWTYVITTSDKPIKAGSQVRLAEGV